MSNMAIIMNALIAPIDPILSELRSVDASTVKNKYRDVAALAAKGAIAISRYTRPELVIMPAGIPHSVRANQRFKMLLIMIRQ